MHKPETFSWLTGQDALAAGAFVAFLREQNDGAGLPPEEHLKPSEFRFWRGADGHLKFDAKDQQSEVFYWNAFVKKWESADEAGVSDE